MARFCTQCGAALEDQIRFCTQCGAAAENNESVQPVKAERKEQQASVNSTAAQEAFAKPVKKEEPEKGGEYEPISTLGWIGIFLILCIPIAGLVCLILWAAGKCRKVNKKTFARAALIMMVIGAVASFAAAKALYSVAEKAFYEIRQEMGEGATEDQENALGGLLEFLGDKEGLSGMNLDELQELEGLLNGLEGMTGESGSDLGGLEEILNQYQTEQLQK